MRYALAILPVFLCLAAFAETPQGALKRLVEGNQRYAKDQCLHVNHNSDRRDELTIKQQPFAIILGCSDSRVPPEIIFDQGLGDLFIVRVAGNILGNTEQDSIDFAVKALGASLIVVLGHESCGAVSSVLKGQAGDIPHIAELIRPAIKGIRNQEQAIKANVRWTVDALKKSAWLSDLIKEKKIDCVGAYYHLGSGKVELLNPKQPFLRRQ